MLDLTDDRGQLCGHLLASLGAEVIAVEPPGGSRSRRLGPFWHDREDPEGSLGHWAFNRGKRSVVVDLDGPEGRDDFLRLVAGADVVVESADPGVMAARGLGYEALAEVNPSLVHASVTAFGSDGPKAGWAATDLPLVAAGGQGWLTGDADRAPLRISVPQAYHHAAADAACGVLLALNERARSGRGQHVDTSAQQSVMQATQSMVLAHALGATELARMAGGVKAGPINLQLRWACRDGYVSVTFFFGSAIGPFSRNLMHWVHEEGFCDEATRDKDWINYTNLLLDGSEPIAEYERVKRILDQFFLTKTKAELLEASQTRRLLIVPVTTIDEVVDSPQFTAREYWQDVDQGDFGRVRYPGALAKLTATPLPSLGPPPRLGAHTAAVLAEPPRRPAAPDPGAPATDGDRRGALDGLKVLDLCWVMAGPAATRVLTDYGADVVRVESARSLDTARGLQPFKNDGNGIDESGLFNNLNAGKRGLALDLAQPASRDVFFDLVRWCDVVVESFSPQGHAQLGPRLRIVASGQAGPDHGVELPDGPDRSAGHAGRLRDDGGRHLRLVQHHRLARPAAGRPVLRLHRLRGPPHVPVLPPRRRRAPPHHRRRAVHRPVPGRGLPPSAVSGAARLHGQRPGGRAGRQRRPGLRPPRGLPRRRRRPLGGDLLCRRRRVHRPLRPDRPPRSGPHGPRRTADPGAGSWTRRSSPGRPARPPTPSSRPASRAGSPPTGSTTAPTASPTPSSSTAATTSRSSTRRRAPPGSSRAGSACRGPPPSSTRGGPSLGEHGWDVLSDLLGYDADRIADLAAAELLE